MRTPHTVVGVQGEQHEEEEFHSVNIEDDDINTGDWGHTWKTVEVSSSYTGHTRVGKVNLISGHTEEGVTILVEKVPREVIKSEAMFWVSVSVGRSIGRDHTGVRLR